MPDLISRGGIVSGSAPLFRNSQLAADLLDQLVQHERAAGDRRLKFGRCQSVGDQLLQFRPVAEQPAGDDEPPWYMR